MAANPSEKAIAVQGTVCASGGEFAPMARKMSADAGRIGVCDEIHQSAAKVIMLPYTRHRSSRKVPNETLMRCRLDAQEMSTTAYCSISVTVVAARRNGDSA